MEPLCQWKKNILIQFCVLKQQQQGRLKQFKKQKVNGPIEM